MRARAANTADAAPIARIYNQGIQERNATFETRPRSAEDVSGWFDGVHPIVVVEHDGEVIAFAATFPYRPRECYSGIAEVSVYVDGRFRRRGAGRAALAELLRLAERARYWKLVSRVFPDNAGSRRSGVVVARASTMCPDIAFGAVASHLPARRSRQSVSVIP